MRSENLAYKLKLHFEVYIAWTPIYDNFFFADDRMAVKLYERGQDIMKSLEASYVEVSDVLQYIQTTCNVQTAAFLFSDLR